jgi:dolichol-phosphate mannosyltransferase
VGELVSRPAGAPSALGEPRLLVSLATYNEAGNLAGLIAEIHKVVPEADLLVIDDNSPDGTGRIASELAERDPRIHVLHRPGKLGLGTATLAAMQFAMARDYDYLLNMDADFSHPPRYLPGILAGMSTYDVMIGSRYVHGGGTENWPLPRRIISQCVNMLVRLLFRMPVKDASGAYRCYRVSTLRNSSAFAPGAIPSSRKSYSAATRRAASSASTRSCSRIAAPARAR